MAHTRKSQPPETEISNPPGTFPPFRRGVRRLLAPVERFLAIEASSGIVLMIVAVAALVWANSPWRDSYFNLWHIPIGFTFGGFVFERELHFLINDGLMTIFFFLVGLEIRREMHRGELSELRRASLPLAAAVGGMLVPAVIYLSLNAGRASASGWAVPMATDIAFAVGALALLGKRVAPALRILLLALAVIDDVGAILVIALFYSSGLVAAGFQILAAGIVATMVLQMLGVRSPAVYIAPGVVIWAGAYAGGIHPTLAGVIVGFLTPVRAWYGPENFVKSAEANVDSLKNGGARDERDLLPHLDTMKVATREAVSPVERLQHMLHGWVAFGIMPLFAFANAGVPLGQVDFSGDALFVFWGIMLGLVVGKPVGILAVAWLASLAGAAKLPRGVLWPHVGVVGMVGGIGFTMALFIAQLAFVPGPMLETAKLAILAGSAVAGIASLVVGYKVLKTERGPGYAKTAAEAEASTES